MQIVSEATDTEWMITREVRETLGKLFRSCGNGLRQPETSVLAETFDAMVRQRDQVRIILDGLDESDKAKRTELLQWLKSRIQIRSRAKGKVQIIMTSRSDQIDFRLLDESSIGPTKICIENESLKADIRSYIHLRLQKDDRFEVWRDLKPSGRFSRAGILGLVESKLVDRGGMM